MTSIGWVVVALLVLLFLGLMPAWPYSAGWGYYPSGIVGLLMLVVLVMLVLGNTRGGRVP